MQNLKEWLNTKTFEYKQAVCMFGHSDWIEIPNAAECAILGTDNNIYFWRSHWFMGGTRGKWIDMGSGYDANWYLNSIKGVKLVWQRPAQPEALPFIDDEPRGLNDQYTEIEQVRQQTIEATLAERQSTYGNFEDVAFVTENIMATLSRVRTNGLDELPHTHRMALYMIASKMARIVNGDFNFIESWHDISGYAKLIENELMKTDGATSSRVVYQVVKDGVLGDKNES